MFLGEVIEARTQLEQGLARYDPQQPPSLILRQDFDPGVSCHGYLAVTLWFLGFPEQAVQRSRTALALAQERSHPFILAYAACFAAVVHQSCREVHAAQAQAEAVIALCTEQEFTLFSAMATILRGWALAAQGQGAAGQGQMHQGLATFRATGTELMKGYFLSLLAEVYGNAGQGDAGLTILEEALAVVNTSDARIWEAELHWRKGELLLTRSMTYHAEVEPCLRRALDIARSRHMKSLELRAAVSLSRLWQQQGKRDAARELLAPIYHWFTEGLDTADLQESKALLEALT